MKKFITKAAIVAAFAAVAGYGIYTSQKQEVILSDTALANVEALARNEGSSDCEIYCTTDWNCTCILKYYGSNVEHKTCPDSRGK